MRKLSKYEASILETLHNAGRAMYGLDLCRATGVSRGAIYVMLDDLEERDFVRSRPEHSAPPDESQPGYGLVPRRVYQITAAGVTALRQLTGS